MYKTEQDSALSELLHFLEQPESYLHDVDKVLHIQTHISHVFIAGSYVYKLKKPVNFDFLDYSTLEKRRELCYREVELNRRLSDEIYLGVIGFARDDETWTFEEDHLKSENIIEYAVKMNKLPEDGFLHRFTEKDRLTREHLDRVADKLAAFYLDQNQQTELSKWGEIESIKVNTSENFQQTKQFINHTIHQNSYSAIRYYTNCYYQQYRKLFHRRIMENRIVDGHGDLHLEHIHITPEKVQIYDCIEFNERFRYGDVAADLAYLAMDLDFNKYWLEERHFMNRMSEKLEDEDLLQIIDFYKCYRAYVKGKVKSLQSAEEEVTKEDRENAANRARQYFKLSLHYALLGSSPVVIIIMGRIGTGKSTIANLLAEHVNIDHYSSDIIRKTEAGLPLTKRTPSIRRKELYSDDLTRKTYDRLFKKALISVRQGQTLLLDATFGNQKIRQKCIRTLENEGANYLFIEAKASDATIINRLLSRDEGKENISDARAEDFEKLSAKYNAPEDLDQQKLITVNTDQDKEETLEELFKKLIDLNLKKTPND